MELDFDRIKWLDNLKKGDIVLYSNGTVSKIQEIKYKIYDDIFWLKSFFTEHGDNFNCKGITILGHDEVVWLIKNE